jgi:DNA-binding transcriptional LysR family regulator
MRVHNHGPRTLDKVDFFALSGGGRCCTFGSAMTYLLPPLNALRAFEAAARHSSFKLAAHELHVTPGAIAQQVRGLEAHLGVALFERLTRRIVLTSAGAAYLPPLRDAFTRIADATELARPAGACAVVRLGLHGGIDAADVLRRLARFRAEHPAIHVPLSRPAGLHELAEGKVDLLIDRDAGCHPGYRCDPLQHDGMAADVLICPAGTADCPEIVALRGCLLAPALAVSAA